MKLVKNDVVEDLLYADMNIILTSFSYNYHAKRYAGGVRINSTIDKFISNAGL